MTQTNAPTEKKDLRASRTGAHLLENKCAVVFGASEQLL